MMPARVLLRASWSDLSVACTEHDAASRETRVGGGPNALSVALLPIECAVWRVGGGSTRESHVLAGTTSVRGSQEVIWARWSQPCRCIHLSLQPDLLERVAQDSGASWHGLEYREGVHDATVLHCALLLSQEAANGGLAGELYVQSIANVLAIHALRTYGGVEAHDIPAAKRPLELLRLRRVKDYIDENLGAPVSLEVLAREAALSPFHFCRSFKAATGLAPHQYLTLRRIERAKILLASTKLPIADVAYWVGIANQSHFTAQFRKVVGCTPKQFRQARSSW